MYFFARVDLFLTHLDTRKDGNNGDLVYLDMLWYLYSLVLFFVSGKDIEKDKEEKCIHIQRVPTRNLDLISKYLLVKIVCGNLTD
jgi:hypothetical protein